MRPPPAALKGNVFNPLQWLGLSCILILAIALGAAFPTPLHQTKGDIKNLSLQKPLDAAIDIEKIVEDWAKTVYGKAHDVARQTYHAVSSYWTTSQERGQSSVEVKEGEVSDSLTQSALTPVNLTTIQLPSNRIKVKVATNLPIITPVYFNRQAPNRGARVAIVARGINDNGRIAVIVEDGIILSSVGKAAVLRVKPYDALLLRELKNIAVFEFVNILAGGQSPMQGQRVKSLEDARSLLGRIRSGG